MNFVLNSAQDAGQNAGDYAFRRVAPLPGAARLTRPDRKHVVQTLNRWELPPTSTRMR